MSIRTSLCDLFGIKHPVVLAPMAGVSGGSLAAAVSHAGGFITWSLARQPELLDLALNRSPAALMLSFGDFKPFLPRISNAQTKFIVQVQTLEQAQDAVDAGTDAIVAQGKEAGGHGGTRSTLPFVPAVVGEAADLIRRREPAQVILEKMMSQAEDRLRCLTRLGEPIKED